MSIAGRQRTCAVCGKPIADIDEFELQPLVDDRVRYVVVHHGESIICTKNLDKPIE